MQRNGAQWIKGSTNQADRDDSALYILCAVLCTVQVIAHLHTTSRKTHTPLTFMYSGSYLNSCRAELKRVTGKQTLK